VVKGNTVAPSGVNGLENNQIEDNTLSASSALDIRDETAGAGTAGTRNGYSGNQCVTSSPAGPCAP
jgi:hypothetical protein